MDGDGANMLVIQVIYLLRLASIKSRLRIWGLLRVGRLVSNLFFFCV